MLLFMIACSAREVVTQAAHSFLQHRHRFGIGKAHVLGSAVLAEVDARRDRNPSFFKHIPTNIFLLHCQEPEIC